MMICKYFLFIYTIDHDGSSIKIVLNAEIKIFFKVKVDLPMTEEQKDGCKSLLVGSCPYEKDQLMTHHGTVKVEKNLPVPKGKKITILADYRSPSGSLACAKLEGIVK